MLIKITSSRGLGIKVVAHPSLRRRRPSLLLGNDVYLEEIVFLLSIYIYSTLLNPLLDFRPCQGAK